jgi:hypothetical protein
LSTKLMKKGIVAALALLGCLCICMQSTQADSAVAWDGRGHFGAAAGYPLNEAQQRAIERCRRNGGINPRIVGATETIGYGAIAVARRGTGSVIGISLGRPSPADAENRAIEKCLKAGGINPKIRWGFKG